jgi:hypothetical protein
MTDLGEMTIFKLDLPEIGFGNGIEVAMDGFRWQNFVLAEMKLLDLDRAYQVCSDIFFT